MSLRAFLRPFLLYKLHHTSDLHLHRHMNSCLRHIARAAAAAAHRSMHFKQTLRSPDSPNKQPGLPAYRQQCRREVIAYEVGGAGSFAPGSRRPPAVNIANARISPFTGMTGPDLFQRLATSCMRGLTSRPRGSMPAAFTG